MKQKPQNIATPDYVAMLEESVLRLTNEVNVYKQKQAENTKSLAFLNGILEQSLAGIYVIEDVGFQYVNQVFANIFGYASSSEIVHKIEMLELVAPECRDLVFSNVRKRISGETDEIRYTFAGLRKDGSRNLVEVHGRSMVIEGKRTVIGLILDITDYDRVTSLAFYDALTKLPNRALFHDRLAQAISQSTRHQESFGLLFMDLDGFKSANDRLGHAAGDYVLQEFSKRLLKLFRETDTVARFGGDEFVAILTTTKDHLTVVRQASRIIECLEIPIQFEEYAVAIGVSIGISMFPHNGKEIEHLLHSADSAMYEAKKAGKNTYRFANFSGLGLDQQAR